MWQAFPHKLVEKVGVRAKEKVEGGEREMGEKVIQSEKCGHPGMGLLIGAVWQC